MKTTANNNGIDATGNELARKYNLKLNSKTGLYDCYGNVEVGKDLVKDGRLVIKFGAVLGYFDCSVKGLTSLEGCPREVGGDFYCDHNYLTSLKGCPQEVGCDFHCANNSLTSLEGAPRKVGGGFYCYNNTLTTLKGCPCEVGGDFDCSNNNLTSLKGCPQKVGGNFDCNTNNLTSIEGAPQSVGGYFDCSFNNLTSIEGSPRKVGEDFYCVRNDLASLEGAPQEVGGDFYCQRTVLDCKDTATVESDKNDNAACNAPDATKAKINVIVRTDEGFTVETHHPLVEARVPLFDRAERLSNPAKDMLEGLSSGERLEDYIERYAVL